jgi:hypothetical protein
MKTMHWTKMAQSCAALATMPFAAFMVLKRTLLCREYNLPTQGSLLTGECENGSKV